MKKKQWLSEAETLALLHSGYVLAKHSRSYWISKEPGSVTMFSKGNVKEKLAVSIIDKYSMTHRPTIEDCIIYELKG